MKLPSLITRLLPAQDGAHASPTFVSAKKFFDRRTELVGAIKKINGQLSEISANSDSLLSAEQGDTAEDLTNRLADNDVKAGALLRMLKASEGRLTEHDAGLCMASIELRSAVNEARHAVAQAMRDLIRVKLGSYLFECIAGLDENSKIETTTAIEAMIEKHPMIVRESHRHFPVFVLSDVHLEMYLSMVSAWFRDIELCGKRISAIKAMQAGERPFSIEFEDEDIETVKKFCATKRYPENYVTLATRMAERTRNIAWYERVKSRCKEMGYTPEAVGVFHPDEAVSRNDPMYVTPDELKLSGTN